MFMIIETLFSTKSWWSWVWKEGFCFWCSLALHHSYMPSCQL